MRWYSFISCCAVVLLYLLYHEERRRLPPDLVEEMVACTTKKVIDGDTLIARCHGNEYRVRLTNIDAPERAQAPYGERATLALKKLVSNQHITLNVQGKDKYQRTLGNIFVAEKDVSKTLVEQGQAVVYARYHPPQYLLDAQKAAKRAKIGVWEAKGLHQDPSYYRKIK